MTKLNPAPIIAEHQHGWWVWRVYAIGKHRYEVVREAVPGSCSYPRQRWVRTYRTRWFAVRRCRIGTLLPQSH